MNTSNCFCHLILVYTVSEVLGLCTNTLHVNIPLRPFLLHVGSYKDKLSILRY